MKLLILSIFCSFILLANTNSINTIVVLIKFQNESNFSGTRAALDLIFNSPSSSSLKNYYSEVSYNKISINSYIYPISPLNENLAYTFPRTRGYFQPYSGSNLIGYKNIREGRLREQEIIDSAVNYIRAQIPDSLDLDFNNDGFVDNFMIIFKGSPGAWGDVGLWPHSGVQDAVLSEINGKRVYHYSIHLESSFGSSVACHETFHVFGAPDLYRYFTSGTPVGSWDIMASGNSHMGAFMKHKYGNWIDTIPLISQSGTYTLNPLTSPDNNCYRINSPYSKDEFFVLEYRVKTGLYESSIPGSGLLVYRINTKAGDGNGAGPPDEVYIFRPGGTVTAGGSISQAHFSSNVGRTYINDFTSNPKAFLSDGSPAGIDIRNIGSSGATISFDVKIVSCRITSPEDISVFTYNHNVELVAEAHDSSDIQRVEFYRDTVLLATVFEAPYKTKWLTTNTCLGKHTIKAIAYSSSGVRATDSITVYVYEPRPLIITGTNRDTIDIGMNDSLSLPLTILSPFNPLTTVNYYLDDSLKYSQTNPPFSFDWGVHNTTYGTHRLRIEAIDSANKASYEDVFIKVIKYHINEDFERDFPPLNWFVNSNIWGWYHSDKGAFSGNYCAATRNYHAAGEAILETPPIEITEPTSLEFYWLDRSLDITSPLIIGADTTFCEVSVNNGPYVLLRLLSAPIAQSDYQKELIDLTPYLGNTITIRWRDVSDESLNAQGTALDKVVIKSVPAIPTSIEDNINLYSFNLWQNYPNPFNPSTNIRYQISKNGKVTLKLYDILGREIATLINKEQEAGSYEYFFNPVKLGLYLSSGIYICRLQSNEQSESIKMLLLK